ncbi:hypothetical protein RIF29_17165 [Crotalaria pallida]|uniref:RRM domain-containing protein n=1 Tax=Crotalaria pallida TaxID=3830 RepID=A0AAN9FHX3_CROPI
MRERERERERAREPEREGIIGRDRVAGRLPSGDQLYPRRALQARQQNAITFFTNFPDEYNIVDLWKCFSAVGKVGEVFVPTKLDRLGKRFGFVRFSDQCNLARLEDKLKDF